MAKKNARQTECLNNLKQLQTGWQLYLGDHSDRMPPNLWDGVPAAAAGSAPGSWVVGNALETNSANIKAGVDWSYHPALGIYHCPEDHSLASDNSTLRFRSYSLLNYLGADPNDPGSNSRSKQRGSQLKHPGAVLAFGCEDSDSINDGILFIYPPPGNEWKDVPASRHSRGGVFSFADGHVEYWKWKSAREPNEQEDLARVQTALPEP